MLRTEGRMPPSTRRTSSTTRRRVSRNLAQPAGGRNSRSGKVRKAFWLDPRLLADARAILGASSERAAVEMALDLVGFRTELLRSANSLRGLNLSRID